ncbi:tetratricopeptide repeat protein [Desulfonatronovibrio magnus]|uniref:tetratricopeptide repeat protein n=1 Tax=Desulfonatronovibrio magnus TaxID=698827 RepID=UPI0005EB59F1|nr:tetratricopeptide repeat protein [Desulfonatronovibrio magnus]
MFKILPIVMIFTFLLMNCALATTKTTVEWRNEAIALEVKEDWQGVINHALDWTKAVPDDDMAWFQLGFGYIQLGRFSQSIFAYQRALKINPHLAEAWHGLGSAYLETEQYLQARDANQKALEIIPEDVGAWINLGLASK